MEFAVLLWVVCGFLGAVIGQPKNRKVDGVILGLVLGFIGLIILVFLPPLERERSCIGVLARAVLISAVIVGIVAFGLWKYYAPEREAQRKRSEQLRAENEARARNEPVEAVRTNATPAPSARQKSPGEVAAEIERRYRSR